MAGKKRMIPNDIIRDEYYDGVVGIINPNVTQHILREPYEYEGANSLMWLYAPKKITIKRLRQNIFSHVSLVEEVVQEGYKVSYIEEYIAELFITNYIVGYFTNKAVSIKKGWAIDVLYPSPKIGDEHYRVRMVGNVDVDRLMDSIPVGVELVELK